MAADILAYRATHVPVGEDQKQHLELSRISRKSSTRITRLPIRAHGHDDSFFPLPEPLIQGSATRVMSLRDGSKKMSKSDASDQSRINLTDDADAIAHKIRRAKTDPIRCHRRRKGSMGVRRQITSWASMPRLRAIGKDDVLREFGGAQFSTFKAALVELAVGKLAPINAEMKRLTGDQVHIDSLLAEGAARAQAIAAETMNAVKDIVGLVRQ